MSRREELEREIRDLEEKIAEVREDIRDCHGQVEYYEVKLKEKDIDFSGERNAAVNDHEKDTFGASLDDISNETEELWQRKHQIENQHNDEASDIKANLQHYQEELNGLYKELHEYEADLEIKNQELLNLPHEQEESPYRESYEEPVNYDYERHDNNRDDEAGYFYKPTAKQPTQKTDSRSRLVLKNDGYNLHRTGLYEYAKLCNKGYKELHAVSGGYRASVGDTIFDYHNPNDLVISNSKGVPSISDFKAIFKIEKKSGRMTMPIENISNKEYMARLIVGAFEAGMVLRGNFKLSEKDMQKLNPETKKKYQEHIRAFDLKIAKRKEMIKKTFQK